MEETFLKIQKFKDLASTNEFSTDSFQLQGDLERAFDKATEFNVREGLFGLPQVDYPKLQEIQVAFKPFYDLTTMSYEAKGNIIDWTQQPLLK